MVTQPQELYSKHAEEALLGAVLVDPSILPDVKLDAEDLYVERNRWIWEAIGEIAKRGEVADFVTLGAELDRRQKLGVIGGPAYLVGLINQCPSALNFAGYASVVREKAKRRRVVRIAEELANAVYNPERDMQTAVSEAVDKLSRSVTAARGARPLAEFLRLVDDEVTAAAENPGDLMGISTGFLDWDAYGGLERSAVLKLTGLPGVGKSLLAFQVLINAAKRGHKCALYQMEMSGKQVARRGLSSESGITTKAMRTGRVKEGEWPQYFQALEAMSVLPIYVSDSSELTTLDFRVDAQRIKDAYGLDLVVVDYEALFRDAPEKGEVERRSLISDHVKAASKDLDIAVISIGDMLKEGIQGKSSGQGAIAGTGRELHNPDQIATLTKDESVQNKYMLIWSKNREGTPDQFVPLTKLQGIPAFADYVEPGRITSAANRAGGKRA